jgi:hypothetical protein
MNKKDRADYEASRDEKLDHLLEVIKQKSKELIHLAEGMNEKIKLKTISVKELDAFLTESYMLDMYKKIFIDITIEMIKITITKQAGVPKMENPPPPPEPRKNRWVNYMATFK